MAITVASLGNGNTIGIHGLMEPVDEVDVVKNRLKEKH